jgi:hypothetical protein
MNALTRIAAEPALSPLPNVLEYGPAVRVHYPGETGLRLTLRCDLMAIRDRATVGLMRARSDAAITLQEAARLAGLYALANIPTKALFQMHSATTSLVDAATAIELCMKGARSTQVGGDNAGG